MITPMSTGIGLFISFIMMVINIIRTFTAETERREKSSHHAVVFWIWCVIIALVLFIYSWFAVVFSSVQAHQV